MRTAASADRIAALRARAALATALVLALGSGCSDPASSPAATYELSDITFGPERSMVLSRWVVRGEVQRFGLGIARVDAPREIELLAEGIESPEDSRRWRARVLSARRSRSIVLGPKDLLKPSGEAAGAADPDLRALAALRGAKLELRSAGRGALARASDLPQLEVSPAGIGDLLSAFDLRVLPCPERVVVGELAPPQTATWRLPALGGTLGLRWRCAALTPESPQTLRLAGPVEASWWREGASREAPPTRRGQGTATWELDLQQRRFRGFELVLDGVLDPDPGADPEVQANARLQVELRWEPFARDSRAARAWSARAARSTARALARVFVDTFVRRLRWTAQRGRGGG